MSNETVEKKKIYCPLCFQPMTQRSNNSTKYDCLREHGKSKETVWIDTRRYENTDCKQIS